MDSYFNYFTEIEEHFQRRRGDALLLSTLDWALIETWKDAGIPLQAVLRGVDETFDKYERRPSKTRKVNGLAFCAQEVLAAAEAMKEAAVGVQIPLEQQRPVAGLPNSEIAAFLRQNALRLESSEFPENGVVSGRLQAKEAASTLRALAESMEGGTPPRLEQVEQHLTVLEEKLLAVLFMVTADEAMVAVRAEADRELLPYRSKMPAVQIGQLQKQYVQKRLLEKYKLPRLSLFYM